MTFGVDGDERFHFDPVPRVIDADEWARLDAGLRQRVRALNALVRDVYGERRIVRAGVVSAATIERAKGYEPELHGRLPATGWPVAIIGFDVVRAPDGAFLVLEDNLRTPSGFAYAVAARRALAARCRPACRRAGRSTRSRGGCSTAALRAAAPRGRGDDPTIVVVTDGPDNVAYYEHEESARRIGAVLAIVDDLVDDGDRVRVRLPDGTSRPVDVVYRRTDEDRLRGDDGEPTELAKALLEPWLAGRIGLVNGFGNGLADDKLVHGIVEDCVRFYLGEEPLVRSVPGHATRRRADGRPAARARRQAARRLRRRRGRHRRARRDGGPRAHSRARSRTTPSASSPSRSSRCHGIRRSSTVGSSCDTSTCGRSCSAGTGWRLLPGGLTRVALDDGALVVNSSQNGGGKDTWIV